MITLLREGTLIIRVYRAWWWAWLPATPVRAGNTDKRKYKTEHGKQRPLWKFNILDDTYIYSIYINTDLYPGKSKTVPPPILPTRLVRSLIKISMVQKPTSGEQYAIVCMHYLHITWISKNLFNYSNSLFSGINLPLKRLPLHIIVPDKFNDLFLSFAAIPGSM